MPRRRAPAIDPQPTFRSLIIGSEALPFAKTGGLADVLGALPPALARLGWDVTLALPRYRGVDAGVLSSAFPLTVGGSRHDVALFEAPLGDGARALLVDVPALFDRDGLYGVGQRRLSGQRRAASRVLVRAALEFAGARGAAPVGRPRARLAGRPRARLSEDAATPRIRRSAGTPSVFTIHNLAYQGLFERRLAAAPRSAVGRCSASIRLEFWGRISFLKGGINDAGADHDGQPALRARRFRRRSSASASTASCGSRAADLVGILNGIDTEQWDPARDPHPAGAVQRRRPVGQAARRSARCSRATACRPTTAPLGRPLVGMISRMVDQKGFDLIAALADRARRARTPPSSCSAPARRATRTSGASSRRGIPIGSARASASTRGSRI